MMKKILFATCALAAGLFAFWACTDNDAGTSRVSFLLTDAPSEADYKAVWIDIQSVSYSTDGAGWVALPVRPTKVDVLKLANGADTLLSDIRLQTGVRVQQIRLVLGSDNTLELADGTVHPLGTPSGQSSGLKLNVHSAAAVSGGYKVVIDFDASRSIVVKGNGDYALKPVIRAFIEASTSSISGTISPADIATRVFTRTTEQDTVATISDPAQGNRFMLRGLSSGTYEIQGQDLTSGAIFNLKSDVVVVGGTDVEVGTLDRPQ